MERVSVIEPSGVATPAIIVAPHGADDDFTAEIAEQIAIEADCYAVINNCFKRSENVDIFKDRANCNNNSHTEQDVVHDEFMYPILRYVGRIQKTVQNVEVFIIHGMSNDIRKKAGTSEIDIVLGTGLGKPKSLTLSDNRRNLIISCLQQAKFKIFEGKEGGDYSGWSKYNLNQYFRKWAGNPSVYSVQLEIIKDLREDVDTAKITGSYLGEAIKSYLDNLNTRLVPNLKIPFV
jgi:hypothetical protein